MKYANAWALLQGHLLPSEEAIEGVRAMSDRFQKVLEKRDQETTTTHLKEIMKNLKLILDQAMDALNIPPQDRETYIGLVGKA
ncbi:MAG: hypothetical protein IJT34_03390 [Butyrivibrio sp.]|nr:hypothetical protein [Butyrivibrio sp.]